MAVKFKEDNKDKLFHEWHNEIDPQLRGIILEFEDWLHHKHRVRDVTIICIKRTAEEHAEIKVVNDNAACPHFWSPSQAVDLAADFPAVLEPEIGRHLLEGGAGVGTFFRVDRRGRYLHVETPLKIATNRETFEDRSQKIIQ